MNTLTRPVWADINLDHLAHNMVQVKRITKEGTIISAVIKADAYGHGALQVAKTLLKNGADRFAVATLSEALQLRSAFSETEIMVLGYTPDELIEDAIKMRIIQTVYSYEQAYAFNKAAEKLGCKLKVHIKLDTGMRRIGMEINDQTVLDICKIAEMPYLTIEGIFTHFAVADELDKTFTHHQVRLFQDMIKRLESNNVIIPIKHVCNSAGIIDLPEYHFDMVRAGIMLYGLYPSNDVKKDRVELRPVMSLKAKVAHVKTVESGEGVSYGLKFIAPQPTQVATLPIGYADGFTRQLTDKAIGIINGVIKPIIGRICMDQCMMEVNDLTVNVGDTVTLFGEADAVQIHIDRYAEILGTINYEIVCMIGKRVPRRYILDGKAFEVVDMILRQK
ncbi:alanine racemase [Fusibacter bizertensis]|uniref:Alanine racemase n=1 Tax=Fusibacter bizertensis TaxID=1488331 RepID=A0ABT6NBA0_9FIRM|nr:alanine racemase [Fusibacter bizertensis]MDH8677697.1 alanine racemase [Fusibacter bizertensis]